MNIINKGLLKAAMAPLGFYQRLGADPAQVYMILHTKLTLDDRTHNAMQQMRRKQNDKPATMATLGTMLYSAVLGLLYLGVFAIGAEGITRYTFYFSMFLVMLCSLLIADFTSVLLDVRDNYIILTRPVNDRTFLLARLLHILIHLTKLVLPMSLPGLVYTGIKYNWPSAALFLVVVVLLTLFSIFVINAVYLAAMRLVSPRKFQAIVSYMQIILTVVVYASYQLVPRMMVNMGETRFRMGEHWYALLVPSFWFGALTRIFQGYVTPYEIAGAIMGIVLPIVAIWIVVRYMAGVFIRNLTLSYATQENAPAQEKLIVQKKGLSETFSKLLSPKGFQKAGFLFAWRLSGRSRDFRMKVLPSIGYFVVFLGYAVYRTISRDESVAYPLKPSHAAIFLYMTTFTLLLAVTQMSYSDQWKASWVFYARPLQKPGAFILGAFKALTTKFYLLLAVPYCVLAIILLGPAAIPNLLFGLFNALLIAATMTRFAGMQLPFANPTKTNVSVSKFFRALALYGLAGLMGGFHYLISGFTLLLILCSLLALAALWLVLHSIANLGWNNVEQQEV
ncbi:hypothetical protein SAMN05444008_115109 [Cnuella takakiae]|uniref:ABC-2 type transport system permease protein n=1 Tax=Cnuella takakiae TaxID=1302690 RepID=A0A1M5G5K3_9BACT|nr:hypothetical protein [Cnuella takakiae]OLY92337.1 hypothetical protein BUE76_10850 [Cnuella takakiae]SHF98934.1 hypothetical protein SAMN05444008_115109 [Cnuella takakiae]